MKNLLVTILIWGLVIFFLLRKYGRLFTGSSNKKWREYTTLLGLNYIRDENKNFWTKAGEYEQNPKNPREKIRIENVMTGKIKGVETKGYMKFVTKYYGTKQRMQPPEFILELTDNTKTYPHLYIHYQSKIRNFLLKTFVKKKDDYKIDLPPHIDQRISVTSTEVNKAKKILNKLTPLLTKDLEHISISVEKTSKIQLGIRRSKTTKEKITTIQLLVKKLLEIGEEK